MPGLPGRRPLAVPAVPAAPTPTSCCPQDWHPLHTASGSGRASGPYASVRTAVSSAVGEASFWGWMLVMGRIIQSSRCASGSACMHAQGRRWHACFLPVAQAVAHAWWYNAPSHALGARVRTPMHARSRTCVHSHVDAQGGIALGATFAHDGRRPFGAGPWRGPPIVAAVAGGAASRSCFA